MAGPSTALLYSGGRDSRVLLHTVRDQLDDIVVIWVDTQAHYPSTYEEMNTLRAEIPHFFVAQSDQPKDIISNGYPSDVLPARYDHIGRHLNPDPDLRLQSTFACCAKNMWIPLDLAMRDLGVTRCLMGNRADESLRDPRWDRTQNNIEFIYPLRKWTLEMVQNYVVKHKITIPAYYDTEEKSRDCWNCTGYLWERRQAILNLPPLRRLEVTNRIREIHEVARMEMISMEQIIEQAPDHEPLEYC